jgi:hypothetical protein
MAAYKIADEPEESGYAPYAVDPYWPLLAAMLGGSWIALPWFAFNAHAIGSASKKKELLWIVLSPVISLAIALVSLPLMEALGVDVTATSAAMGSVLGMPVRAYAYLGAVIVSLKLFFAYRIHYHQSKSHNIHEAYHGAGKSGLVLVILAALLRPALIAAAGELSIYALILVL